ncbi:MAG: PA2169 family four-helix-bundle protein [Betaproteobacteria bacterium]
MQIEEIAVILDSLARQARDDEAAFRTAAVDADELSLTALSVTCAVMSRERAEELEGMSILYRNGPKPLSHFFAPVTRTWNWLRATLQNRDDVDIVESCKRHEDAARKAYEEVLQLALPANLRAALKNHLSTIRECDGDLRRLRRHIWERANRGEPVTMQANISAFGD